MERMCVFLMASCFMCGFSTRNKTTKNSTLINTKHKYGQETHNFIYIFFFYCVAAVPSKQYNIFLYSFIFLYLNKIYIKTFFAADFSFVFYYFSVQP